MLFADFTFEWDRELAWRNFCTLPIRKGQFDSHIAIDCSFRDPHGTVKRIASAALIEVYDNWINVVLFSF